MGLKPGEPVGSEPAEGRARRVRWAPHLAPSSRLEDAAPAAEDAEDAVLAHGRPQAVTQRSVPLTVPHAPPPVSNATGAPTSARSTLSLTSPIDARTTSS